MNFQPKTILLGWKRSIRFGLSTLCAHLYYYIVYMTIYFQLMIVATDAAAAAAAVETIQHAVPV